jgi:pimeloyl-ACP methyl ester carboxylesterase
MADSWTHHTMKVNGFRMHYIVAGSGYPLVFLHGWPQTSYEWRKIIPSVAERFTIIAPDLRGLGIANAHSLDMTNGRWLLMCINSSKAWDTAALASQATIGVAR